MANNPIFQQRLIAAVKKSANYWDTFPLDNLSNVNLAVQKKKVYATLILKSLVFQQSIQVYATYFLSQYNEANPDLVPLDPPLVESGQLTDAVLTDSASSAKTYEYFAGVEVGDETRPMDF